MDFSSQSIAYIDGMLFINGEKLPPVPGKEKINIVVQKDSRIFINGYEWKCGEWKRTFRSFLSSLF